MKSIFLADFNGLLELDVENTRITKYQHVRTLLSTHASFVVNG